MEAAGFELLPAIDLRGGRVVRLRQGDFARETAYGTDPAATARRFAEAGARWLHVVDLDAARTGFPSSSEAIRAIVREVGDRLSIEVAGGLRSEEAVRAALEQGAARAVVGTAALLQPGFVRRLIGSFGPDLVAVAVDVRDGRAFGEGWLGSRGARVNDVLVRLADEGATIFEVTSIDRDGLLAGPDLDLLAQVISGGHGAVIASGGIASLEDLEAVRAIGCAGAIVGRAFYEGQLTIQDAVRAAHGPSQRSRTR